MPDDEIGDPPPDLDGPFDSALVEAPGAEVVSHFEVDVPSHGTRGSRRGLPPAHERWTALSAKIASHRRHRAAVRWTAGLLAASVVGIVVLSQIRARSGERGAAAGPVIQDVSTLGTGDDEAIALLSRAVAEGRGRLPSSEQKAMDAVLHSIDEAVRHTRSALRADPSDPWLRSHLGELHRKRVSALHDYVDLIRDHG